MKVTFLEPFFGGSHRAFAEGWQKYSVNKVELSTMPARFWKWRMRGAALEYAKRAMKSEPPDIWFTSSTLDVAHFKALTGTQSPIITYFHENQASYPAREGEEIAERDIQYIFTDLATALAADRIAFNSKFQLDEFIAGLKVTMRRMPDHRQGWIYDAIMEKASVVHLGVELADIKIAGERPLNRSEGPPVLLWNHRWEYDKNPEALFVALGELIDRGVEFRLILCGERFLNEPPIFSKARERLGDRVIHWGYADSREEYVSLLLQADIAISTSNQENFGISMVEAAYAGAHPIAPERLSYPEVFTEALHGDCLYSNDEELVERLIKLIKEPPSRLTIDFLREHFGRYDWAKRSVALDALVAEVSC
ncbi:MAG: DUF3524 domain-containing protein [Deltaproteobacteria bacterium]|nr:MAG: DUF3524 domain-containing protein [Deltaproteobacteria bacterium]